MASKGYNSLYDELMDFITLGVFGNFFNSGSGRSLKGASLRPGKIVSRPFYNNSSSINNTNSIKTGKKLSNNYNDQELKRMMRNAEKARELLSGLKTTAQRPKNHNLF